MRSFALATGVGIKDKCLFSSDIYISTTDSHSIVDNASGQRINPSKDITINDHVWVGHKASIGKGVEIAADVVIGGSSFVSHSILESNTIAAGIPARILKHGINWDEKRI